MNQESARRKAAKAQRARVVEGIRQGSPVVGPTQVHVDITNGCNAACITCWDHSPLLNTPRSNDWKRRRMSLDRFLALVADLDSMGSVQAVVLSGMGDPLTHPRVYEMMAAVKARGWHLTLLSNLLAADTERLLDAGVDNLLVGVHGASPDTYAAFHPGWSEQHFFRLCKMLRALSRGGVQTRHVQDINRDTADELVEMVRFGRTFGAQRVNYKLASLYDGTEGCSITAAQRERLLSQDLPRARELAAQLGVNTNLDLFEQQLLDARADLRRTTDMSSVGCYMGYVYTRVTVDGEVLYCCNTQIKVGALDQAPLSELWWGERWQAMREQLAGGRYFKGCEVCGKVEQNRKWAQRLGLP